MKKYSILLFFILVYSTSFSQIVGGEIDVHSLGNNRFEVIAYTNQPCGSNYIQPSIQCRLNTQVFLADSISLISSEDVQSSMNSCYNSDPCLVSAGRRKVKRIGFRGIIDLPSNSTCQVVFFFRDSLYNFNSSTIVDRKYIYISTVLNRCEAPDYSTPTRLTGQQIFICRNVTTSMNFSMVNQSLPEDSITYAFYSAKTNENESVTYSANYLPNRWVKFWGWPNQNLSLKIDPHTGIINFMPTELDQIASVVVEVKIYRKVNGQPLLIATKYIEHQITITGNINTPPMLFTQFSYKTCVGEKICIMVQSHDNQVTDTTTMIFHMGAMHNAQIKQTGFGNFPVFEICWTPSTDATNSTNTFAVDVFDNYCPSNGMNSYVFKVEVVKPPSYSFKVQNTDSICSGLDIDIQFPPSSPGLNYNWEILDSSKQHSFHSSKLAFEHLELEKGNYYVYLHSNVGGLCYQFYDTLFDVIGSETPKYKINDHFLTGCEGEQRIIGIDSAKKTYSYSWQDGYTGRNRVISLGFDTLSYSIEIQNGSCILRDSIWIYPSPAPDLSRFYEWKDKDSLRLSINNPMVGVKYSWYADFATTPLASGNFVVVDLADSINHHLRLLGENFRCRTEDTFTVLAANRTGFNEALQEGKYSIYPNPFFSKIHIQGPETFRVILFDATGKELIRTQVVHEHFTLDQLQAYSKGIYLLYVEGSDGRSIYRLVKE